MGRAFEYRKAAKMKRWGHMSRVFPKLGKIITIAAKEGGPDPDMNPKLRQAILNAKAENMPKDNIDAAIKRATDKNTADMVEIVYEGKGPHGVLCVVECATDNTTRTVANVRSYFNKAGGELLKTGQLEYMFTRKAVFQIEIPAGMSKDDLELELIDAGLEEIEETEDGTFAYSDWTAYGTMHEALEGMKINIVKANLQRFANNPVAFNDEQIESIMNFLDKVEDDEDVQAVYTNME
ncbi:MAG: YebC/PmpR family DNA-binding transcriptional regulator [Bacteroidetes bacterium]|jgi:YebC/PmpR family DNA-binding regulatory protein|nr:YebC/PmpR family DNA-binding transcriptional regulator [Bacteroidota bacterium]MBO6056956.1 YebC/PmpR family DNA-binding transcriptional regulator [Bacteroidales bacterium]